MRDNARHGEETNKCNKKAKTSIRDANLHMFLVRLLHTRSPQRLSLVFVLSGFKFGVFLFAVGRDGGRIDLLRRKERKTCKMEPDKDSKIEQNESRTHRSKLSRTTGLYQAGVQNLSCWGPNGIQMGSIEIHFSMDL